MLLKARWDSNNNDRYTFYINKQFRTRVLYACSMGIRSLLRCYEGHEVHEG